MFFICFSRIKWQKRDVPHFFCYERIGNLYDDSPMFGIIHINWHLKIWNKILGKQIHIRVYRIFLRFKELTARHHYLRIKNLIWIFIAFDLLASDYDTSRKWPIVVNWTFAGNVLNVLIDWINLPVCPGSQSIQIFGFVCNVSHLGNDHIHLYAISILQFNQKIVVKYWIDVHYFLWNDIVYNYQWRKFKKMKRHTFTT